MIIIKESSVELDFRLLEPIWNSYHDPVFSSIEIYKGGGYIYSPFPGKSNNFTRLRTDIGLGNKNNRTFIINIHEKSETENVNYQCKKPIVMEDFIFLIDKDYATIDKESLSSNVAGLIKNEIQRANGIEQFKVTKEILDLIGKNNILILVDKKENNYKLFNLNTTDGYYMDGIWFSEKLSEEESPEFEDLEEKIQNGKVITLDDIETLINPLEVYMLVDSYPDVFTDLIMDGISVLQTDLTNQFERYEIDFSEDSGVEILVDDEVEPIAVVNCQQCLQSVIEDDLCELKYNGKDLMICSDCIDVCNYVLSANS